MPAHASKNTNDGTKSGRNYAGTMHANEPFEPSINSPLSAPIIHRKATCPCGGGCQSCQAKASDLKVSQPNDPAEIEADQIADKVMRMPDENARPLTAGVSAGNTVHRKCDACEEDEKEAAETVQRKEAFSSTASTPSQGTPPSIRNVISSGGQPLDKQTRSFFEPRFGNDLSSVRIHTDLSAGQSARVINASAYTLNNHIVFGSGEYSPHTDSGRHLIAHELAHVGQQYSGSTGARRIHRRPEGGGRARRPARPQLCGRDSTQVPGFPDPFINRVDVDLGNLASGLTITWSRTTTETGALPSSFPISPGAGLCRVCCDDRATSRRSGTHCTPKGDFNVTRYGRGHGRCSLNSTSWAHNATFFDEDPAIRGDIAIHTGPLPGHPASHGCVRTTERASRIVFDNTRRTHTSVHVSGTWAGSKCYENAGDDTRRDRTAAEMCPAPAQAPAAPDAGTPDAGSPDAGTPDAGTPDAGTPDAGTTDAGTPGAETPVS